MSSDIDTSDSEEEFPSHKGQSPTEVDYTYFELETAQQALLDHYGILSLESFGCEHLPLAVRAAGAIVLYLRDTRRTGKLHLMNLGVYSTSGFMDLDVHTRRNLELFTAGRNDRREHSLLATLDQTRTPMGGRLASTLVRPAHVGLGGVGAAAGRGELLFQRRFPPRRRRIVFVSGP